MSVVARVTWSPNSPDEGSPSGDSVSSGETWASSGTFMMLPGGCAEGGRYGETRRQDQPRQQGSRRPPEPPSNGLRLVRVAR